MCASLPGRSARHLGRIEEGKIGGRRAGARPGLHHSNLAKEDRRRPSGFMAQMEHIIDGIRVAVSRKNKPEAGCAPLRLSAAT